MKVVEENWHQFLQKFERLCHKQNFVNIIEDFAMNLSKFSKSFIERKNS